MGCAAGANCGLLRTEDWLPITHLGARGDMDLHSAAYAVDPKVSSGPGPRDEHITNLLVLGFLQSCCSCSFHEELQVLGRELLSEAELADSYDCCSYDDDELQTDGNHASFLQMGRAEAGSESQEEVIRNIARRLAQIGDRMDHHIQPELLNNLVVEFVNDHSEEDRRRRLASAVEQAMETWPADMEREKATLMLTMLLAKKLAEHTPSLLRAAFRAAVTLINQDLLAYVRNLAGNGME